MSSIACVELGDNNGGIILNISEGGVALAAVGVLTIDRPPRIRIQPPRSRDWIELTGEIAWVSQSKKEAGVRFDNLTTEVQNLIKDWISSEISAAESPKESGRFARRKVSLPANPKIPASAPHAPDLGMSPVACAEDSLKLKFALPAGSLQTEPKDLDSPDELRPVRAVSAESGCTEPAPGTPERRLYARRRVKSLSYIELSESNGGIVLNISEDGLQVQAAVTLTGDCISLVRFQSPPAGDRIETSGRIVWTSKSKKEAGIQFVALSEDERARIREWVSSQPSSTEIRGVKEVTLEKSERPSATPVALELDSRFGGVEEFVPAVPRVAQTPKPEPISASSSLSAGDRASVSAPSIHPPSLVGSEHHKPGELRKIGPPSRPTQGHRWGMMASLFGIVVVISFFFGWLAARQGARVESPMTAEIRTEPSNQSFRGSGIPATSQIQRPPNHSAKDTPLPSHRDMTAPTNSNTRIPSPAVAVTSSQQRATEQPRQNSSSNVPNQSSEATRSSDHSTRTRPSISAVITSGVPQSDKPSQSPGKVIAQPKDTIPQPLSTALSASQPTPAVTVKKEEGAPAPAKPQEELAVPVGSVSISFPPFPSLRVPPELKSQTARVGTSLQFGQLISRIDPAYPEDARRQLIQGTVKLHAMIGRDGAVQTVALVSGPAQLAPPAMNAIQQWRFKQTLLGGQPIETEEDITVVFRLTNSPARSNSPQQ